MTGETKEEPAGTARSKYRPLRIWPAALLLAAMAGTKLTPLFTENVTFEIAMLAGMGPVLFGLLVLVWWLAASRATRWERVVGFLGVVVAGVIAVAAADKTMLGPGVMVVTIPLGTAGFALGAIVANGRLSYQRTLVALAVAAIGFAVTPLLRFDGMWGDMNIGLHWRWTPTPEEMLLAGKDSTPTAEAPIDEAKLSAWLAEPEWPHFRGADGLSRQHGTILDVAKLDAPPALLWKVPIGPGWSSFCVAGGLLFTQEQLGDLEAVVCLAADTGKELWRRELETRFEEALGGPGPRATPTLAEGALYTTGANGALLRLDPQDGAIIWRADLLQASGRDAPPDWGFAASPLVFDSKVIVHAGGQGNLGVLAFDAETGELVWSAPSGDHAYSSVQLAELQSEEVALCLTNAGLDVLDPRTGKVLLAYEWPFGGYRALQPQVVESDSVLLTTGMGVGARRIKVSHSGDQWTAAEAWNSRHLKPDFNDFVIHDGHAYGFDGTIFACIDLATGERKWKGGRYGKGQVLLLADCELLLVAGEYGEVVFLRADPTALQEVGRFPALDGKTWNHPVVVGDRLYIRNAQEAACYRLPLAESTNRI